MTRQDSLVERAATDSDALGRLYEQYYEKIYRYCVHRLFVRDVAEDVTSIVFVTVAERIGCFRGATQAEFRVWLYAIATNAVNAYVRKRRHRAALLDAAVARGEIGQVPPSDPRDGPKWPAVYRALLGLKPRDQAVITLKFFEGFEAEQIAEVLRCRPGAVRTALSRALDRLRQRLGQER